MFAVRVICDFCILWCQGREQLKDLRFEVIEVEFLQVRRISL
jgi:hypothetical protein